MHSQAYRPSKWKISLLFVALIGASGLLADESRSDFLSQGFSSPPNSAKARAYWWWPESNVSKAGITQDLEEMKRKGIGGALLFDAFSGLDNTEPGPEFMGPEWRDLFKHTVREADRLGIEISVNLASGWDCGGPWITPEYASQKLVFSEQQVQGPTRYFEMLPISPEVQKDNNGNFVFYRDIAVLAYRITNCYMNTMEAASPRITASSSHRKRKFSPIHAMDGDLDTWWISGGNQPGAGPTKENPEWLQFEFAEPYAAEALFIAPHPTFGPHECELQTSEDGNTFQTVSRFTMDGKTPKTVPFSEVRARIFRLLITSSYSYGLTEPIYNVMIDEVQLLKKDEAPKAARLLKHWQLKTSNTFFPTQAVPCEILIEEGPEVPGEVDVEHASVIDLSKEMDESGRLTWDVPEGKWLILRFGHTHSGMAQIAASPGGHGLMLDHLSKEAMDLHFQSMAEKLIEDAGDLAGRSLKYFHCDSWEVGSPNWTHKFREEFQERRGYDLLLYLPVFAKKIVDSREVSNRFLYDFRKTISDCIVDNHYARFRDLSHQHGIGFHPESGGPFFPAIDMLKCLGRNDIPMGEFWVQGGYFLVKEIASAAHIYGKKHVMAEAYTSIGYHWEEDPFFLKQSTDRAFCEGLNRVNFCLYTASPLELRKPGIETWAGTHFNPNITWWEQAQAFTNYISRCQFLLEQGLFVGDVCYYYGDNAPNWVAEKHVDPSLGPGYDYDVTNVEVLLTRMEVRNGQIVLPDGMSYHMLVLPERESMPPGILRKIMELVEAGATVAGPKPTKAPGLKNYPECDRTVNELADKLWGPCDGKTVKQNTYGTGRIIWGETLREVLLADGVKPDFEFKCSRDDAYLDYIHRTADQMEIYFVANRLNRLEEAVCTFRVSGKEPELWNPQTGEMRRQVVYDEADERTKVPLRLPPYGSVFVVFRHPEKGDRIVSMIQNGEEVFTGSPSKIEEFPSIEVLLLGNQSVQLRVWKPGIYEFKNSRGTLTRVEVEPFSEWHDIVGPWEVYFPKGWGAPESKVFEKLISWTEDSEPGVKYFSGTACYKKEFTISSEQMLGNSLFLDLGVVKNIAEVTLNGKDLGILWSPPFRVDITTAVKEGLNQLKIKVTNLWPNRLIGDAFLLEEKRFTQTNITKFKKDSPLLESGLLGPVRIHVAKGGEFDLD
ncbi:MAG: glycosyl hydrolase [bacterium]